VLCRSHLKLDYLASEYHRLGSLSLLLPENSVTMPLLMRVALLRGVDDIAARLGVRALSWSIPPWWETPGFDVAVTQRIFRLRASNAALARATREMTEGFVAQIETPFAAPFFMLSGLTETAGDALRAAKELAQAMSDAGVDAFHAPSFGHDVLAIDAAQATKGAPWGIRISVPDWSATHHSAAKEAMGRWLASKGLSDPSINR
jgi:hypothetical protein